MFLLNFIKFYGDLKTSQLAPFLECSHCVGPFYQDVDHACVALLFLSFQRCFFFNGVKTR